MDKQMVERRANPLVVVAAAVAVTELFVYGAYPKAKDLSPTELAKLVGEISIDSNGVLKATLHNGADKRVEHVVVEITFFSWGPSELGRSDVEFADTTSQQSPQKPTPRAIDNVDTASTNHDSISPEVPTCYRITNWFASIAWILLPETRSATPNS